MLAVVVGAARPDGDPEQHFGSLLGFADHVADAKRLGLVQAARTPAAQDQPRVALTADGRAFVERFGLTQLPAGRANNWSLRHEHILNPADAELTRMWDSLHTAGGPSIQDNSA